MWNVQVVVTYFGLCLIPTECIYVFVYLNIYLFMKLLHRFQLHSFDQLWTDILRWSFRIFLKLKVKSAELDLVSLVAWRCLEDIKTVQLSLTLKKSSPNQWLAVEVTQTRGVQWLFLFCCSFSCYSATTILLKMQTDCLPGHRIMHRHY